MTRTAAPRSGSIHVLIAGGGVAALEAALALRELGDGLFDVELVAPEHHFFYRPLAVAVPFDVGRVYRWELSDLARKGGRGVHARRTRITRRAGACGSHG